MMSPLEEDALLSLAAEGDAEAQSVLANYLLRGDIQGITLGERLVGAEIFARMAASHRRPADMLSLAGVLLLQAEEMKRREDWEREASCLSEGASILDQAARRGDENAAIMLIGLLSGLADQGCEEAANQLNLAVQRYGSKAAAKARLLICETQGEA